MAFLALCFTACEDVPAPYGINDDPNSNSGAVPTPGEDGVILEETFETSLGRFQNFTTSGEGAWKIDFKTAKASGYDNTNKVNVAGVYYLVSPEFSLEGVTEAHLAYEYIYAYAKNFANGDKVMISDQFDAAQADKNWEEIPVTFQEPNKTADGKIDWKSFHKMDIQLPAKYMGKKVRVAFYHACDEKGSATMEIKNLKVMSGKAEGEVTPDPQPQPEGVRELPYTEAFSTTLGGFKSYTASGKGEWTIDFSTAKISNHIGGKEGYDQAGTVLLVSPEISLQGQKEAHVAYEYILRYFKNNEDQQVMINAAFDENNPDNGWKLLNNNHDQSPDWTTFSKADLAIPAEYMGQKIRIAFRYTSTDTGSSTWEVKNFSIAAGKAGDGEVNPQPQPEPQPSEGTLIDWASNTEWTTGEGSVSFTKDPYSIVVAKGESSKTAPIVHDKYFEVRAYAFNTVKVSTTGKNMTKVIFHLAQYAEERLAGFTADNGSVTVDVANKQVVWTGNAKDFTLTVSEFAENGTQSTKNGQFRFRNLSVVTE